MQHSHFRSDRRLLLAGAIASVAASPLAWAQDEPFPSRPIRIVVPFQAGGSTDILTRLVAEKLSPRLGQPVVVDNRPGANTGIAQQFVAAAPADGYTLMLIPSSSVSVPQGKPGHYQAAQFTPIAKICNILLAFVANPKHGFRNVRDVVAYAKANPGKLTYAVSAVGGVDHYAGELFNKRAGVDIRMIAYKGASGALNDLLAGIVDLRWDGYASSRPHIAAGKLTLLGIPEGERAPSLPQVPTVAEQGLSGFEMSGFFGLVGPAGLRAEVVARLNRELNTVLQMPDVRQRLIELGMEPQGGTPDQFQRFLQVSLQSWAKVIKETGVSVEN